MFERFDPAAARPRRQQVVLDQVIRIVAGLGTVGFVAVLLAPLVGIVTGDQAEWRGAFRGAFVISGWLSVLVLPAVLVQAVLRIVGAARPGTVYAAVLVVPAVLAWIGDATSSETLFRGLPSIAAALALLAGLVAWPFLRNRALGALHKAGWAAAAVWGIGLLAFSLLSP